MNETERRFKTPLIERFFETPYTYFFLTILLLLLVLPLSDKFEEVLPVVQILLFAVMMLSLWAARVHGIIFLLFLSL
ncbi:MAG TPA: hypothetical protein VD913_03860, partial [bacterium]|nr:hypothetical protein [bacterium]